jgi:hypothetical protein
LSRGGGERRPANRTKPASLRAQKQEAAFTKQIDQLATSVAQISKASDDKLNDLKKTNDDKFGDLKDRIVAVEGRSSISDPTTAATLRDMGSVISSLKASNDQNVGGRQQKAHITIEFFPHRCGLGARFPCDRHF